MIRREISDELLQCASEFPVVTVIGPRQSGKTTLVRMAFPQKAYYSLEDPDVRAAAEADPRGFLSEAGNDTILDEIQRLPTLLSYIQGVVDSGGTPGMFILTGSHQPRLHEAISQSLAGRTALLTLWPFSLPELRNYKTDWRAFELVVTGCFPRVHHERIRPRRFYNSYLQTYVERDLRALINLRDLSQFQNFLLLLAGRVGQLLNYAALASDTGVSAPTIRNWLSALKSSHVVFELQPYFQNVRKRVKKSPKVFFTDVGLAAFLLGIDTEKEATRSPFRGSLYENLIISEVIKGALNRGIDPHIYFFQDSHGNEVDLVIRQKGKLIPVEIKSAATFSVEFLKGLQRFKALGLPDVTPGVVLYNGEQQFLVKGVRVFNPLKVHNLWEVLTSAETV